MCLDNICFIDKCKFEICLKGHHAGEYAALLRQSAFENCLYLTKPLWFRYSSHFVHVWKSKKVVVRVLSAWQNRLNLNLLTYETIHVFNGQVILKCQHQFKVIKRISLQIR